MTLADKILAFNDSLDLSETPLPTGIRAMNPFRDGDTKIIKRVTKQFYNRFYGDKGTRKFVIGINPGRLGAGLTGVPFTDTKRLLSDCQIEVNEFSTHEPSSVFVYEMIRAYGGAEAFYSDFYINSVSPLGFVKLSDKGKELNYNYYDQPDLTEAVTPFILKTLTQQIAMGLDTETVWTMGGGKNYKFLKKFNAQHKLFGRIIPVDHPRYVVQYKNKYMQDYIQKYLDAFRVGM
jgi:hypothetical protein